jgi:2-phosphoglycerate kinase
MRNGQAQSDLSHVYWVGGTGCAGKSTLAKSLSREYGLAVHEMDDHHDSFWQQMNEAPGQFPKLVKHKQHFDECGDVFMAAEDWAEFMYDLTTEGWPLTRRELDARPDESLICEGAYLNPGILSSSVAPNRVVFLIADEDFQRRHFLSRQNLKEWIDTYRDPDEAFERLTTALGIVARRILADAQEHGTRMFTIDEETNFETIRAEVVTHFGLQQGSAD